ncbi:universal stress protein [Streptomyces sp. NPDC006627]|uniref:universal stress protein n=1 Tax=Streptomyces sp. NPDC006627 TaxID=3154679 RepID=UPI0033BD4BBC
MSLPLVVGVDGSESSMRAMDWAADEAALRRAPLRVVYACLWERYEGTVFTPELSACGQVTAEDIAAAATRRARRRHEGLSVTTTVVPEEAEYVLVRESRNASVLVVGTRGRGALTDALLGSVSLTVAAHAHCPVVVLQGSHDNKAPAGRHASIIVGVAAAPTAAVRFAYEEARRREVPLTAVRAWRRPAHQTANHPLLTGSPERLHEERAVQELEAALAGAPSEVTLRRRTAEGPAHRVLSAASHEADLLIIGRREPKRLGSVAHAVLHHSDWPVAIVPDTV